MSDHTDRVRHQIHEWIEAAESIKEAYGLEKALGYVIGEKFYHVAAYPDIYIDKRDHETCAVILAEFAHAITTHFTKKEIREYFASHPRFGPLGHTMTEEEHSIFVHAGSVEHSVETETRDAITQGKMEELLGIT